MKRIDAILYSKPVAVNPLLQEARARWEKDEDISDDEFLSRLCSAPTAPIQREATEMEKRLSHLLGNPGELRKVGERAWEAFKAKKNRKAH